MVMLEQTLKWGGGILGSIFLVYAYFRVAGTAWFRSKRDSEQLTGRRAFNALVNKDKKLGKGD